MQWLRALYYAERIRRKSRYLSRSPKALRKARRRKLSFSEVFTDQNLEKVLKDTHATDLEDLYLSIGSLRYTAGYIIDLIFEDINSFTVFPR